MLVFLSDLHLTDGRSGTTIHPMAFCKFSDILLDVMGDTPNEIGIYKIQLVLLGDIIDVIRSNLWLRPENNNPEKPIRPWSAESDCDSEGWNLQRYTEEIVKRITSCYINIEARNHLEYLQSKCRKLGVEVELSYIIGNHDWLINRYPSTRQQIARFLGLPNPQCYETHRFPEYLTFPEYGVLARHGDRFDPLNFTGNRDKSSLGDALVIDLLNHLPEEVKADAYLMQYKKLYQQLKEIDNVRPLLEIPAWIKGVCRQFRDPQIESKVRNIWNRLVGDFFKLQYVKDLAWSQPFMWFLLRLALRFTSGVSFDWLMKILASKTIREWYQKTDDYKGDAYKEVKDNNVSYVVYGHTHSAQQIPLNILPLSGERALEQVYFNSGTWRKVFEHTAFEVKDCEFIGWYVLTFIVFYLEPEKEPERNYEVWAASLG